MSTTRRAAPAIWAQRIAAPARDEVLRRWPDASREFKQRACERAGCAMTNGAD
jgi:hypothetical protein